jgi:hypothetical protein
MAGITEFPLFLYEEQTLLGGVRVVTDKTVLFRNRGVLPGPGKVVLFMTAVAEFGPHVL